MGPLILYYWRGTGPLAWLVRTATQSPWDHVAVGVELGGVPCCVESVLGKGVRLIPRDLDPPDASQETGLYWNRARAGDVLQELGQPYDILDGVRAALGLAPKHRGLECAELALRALQAAGLTLDALPTPQRVAEAVEATTGYSVSSFSGRA